MPPPTAPSPDLSVGLDGSTLAVHGAWTLAHLSPLVGRASAAKLARGGCVVDARALTGLDTAGALLLVTTLRRTGRAWSEHKLEGVRPEHEKLLAIVASSAEPPLPSPRRGHGLVLALERLGAEMERFAASSRVLREVRDWTLDEGERDSRTKDD